MGLDRGVQDVRDGERVGLLAVEIVGEGEDAAEVVGGMSPFGGEPGVVVVQPADHDAEVEGGADGIEFVVGAATTWIMRKVMLKNSITRDEGGLTL